MTPKQVFNSFRDSPSKRALIAVPAFAEYHNRLLDAVIEMLNSCDCASPECNCSWFVNKLKEEKIV